MNSAAEEKQVTFYTRKFEYKKESNCSNMDLKNYGLDGWELTSTFVLPDYNKENKHNVYYLFKRIIRS